MIKLSKINYRDAKFQTAKRLTTGYIAQVRAKAWNEEGNAHYLYFTGYGKSQKIALSRAQLSLTYAIEDRETSSTKITNHFGAMKYDILKEGDLFTPYE